ncbi:MAG: NADP-dependent isocitrate dehydrogenase [Methylophilaceae bacterium]|jgi:isocitrate dehydrogenase
MKTQIQKPSAGELIHINSDASIDIPNNPIIPYIEGDGIGADITSPMKEVVDRAIQKAYGQSKKISWMEIYAGEKASQLYGNDVYLPEETLNALKEYTLSIKGPLATPVGGGIRSLNVALRQTLDLFVCLRPIQYYDGVPSPLKNPEKTNMVIFRENTEDIYAGIEWEANSDGSKKIIDLLNSSGFDGKVRFPNSSAIGIKPVSREGSQRLIKKAIDYAINHGRKSVTLVHKGNIMKFTEGGFKNWGYELAKENYGAKINANGQTETAQGVVIKDCIADAFLQEILLRPEDHEVVATLNLNGDYVSDALAAQVGGIGISPGANLSDTTVIFEATHGTAPMIAGKNIANPSSLILSGLMLLEHMQWNDAANILHDAFKITLKNQEVTSDFASQIPGCKALSTNEFANKIISNMN